MDLPRRRGACAIGYCRVSTGRQAAHELSLDEQDRKNRACAELKDGDIIEMFVEQGASGRTDKRPVFQQMIAFALDHASAVDVVIVYNFSRYFRNVASYSSTRWSSVCVRSRSAAKTTLF